MLLLPVRDDDDEDEDDADHDEGHDAHHDVEQHLARLVRGGAGDDPVLGAVGEAALDVVVVEDVLGAGYEGLAHVRGLALVAVPGNLDFLFHISV